MPNVPTRAEARLVAGLKRFQPVLTAARARDVGESDTVTIVTDMLSEVFGYDKYSEITSEHAIRSTYCDLAIKIDGTLKILIEVKAIGLELKESHVKQAIDYAANQGVDWVALTNGVNWRIYRVTFAKPIGQELVIEFDFLAMVPRNSRDIETLFLACKEGWSKSVLGDFHEQRQALNKFFIGAVLTSEPVISVVRRQIRLACPDVKVTPEEILAVLTNEVIKREVVEGEKADEAKRKMSRSARRAEKAKQKDDVAVEVAAPPDTSPCE